MLRNRANVAWSGAGAPFKKHEIDIPFTVKLHGAGGIDPVHVRVKHNLQECPWRYGIYSFIGRTQASQIHCLHKLT